MDPALLKDELLIHITLTEAAVNTGNKEAQNIRSALKVLSAASTATLTLDAKKP